MVRRDDSRRIGLLSVVLLMVSSHMAFADGGLVWETSFLGKANSGGQQAVILYFDNRETMVLKTEYEGELADFSWLIPTPSPVTTNDLHEADANIFLELDDLTAPSFYLNKARYNGCSCSNYLLLGGAGSDSDYSVTTDRDHVEVMETILTKTYEINVLSASKTQHLIDWLDQNNYTYPPEAEAVFESYIFRGWYFLAIRIRPSNTGELTTQSIAPIQISFEVPDTGPVFPMMISSLSSKPQTEILIYFLSDHRYQTRNVLSREVDYYSYYDDEMEDYKERYRRWMMEEIADRYGELYFVEYAGGLPAFDCQSVNGYLNDSSLNCEEDVFITRFRSYFSPDLYMNDIYFKQNETDDFFEVTVYIESFGSVSHSSLYLISLFFLIMTYVTPKRAISNSVRNLTRFGSLMILCLLLF
jgi:hypothetical protein